MELGRAIRAARLDKGWTQAELGTRFGVTKSAVAQWESGKNMPDPRKIGELLQALEIDPAVAVGQIARQSGVDLPHPSTGTRGIVVTDAPQAHGPGDVRPTPAPPLMRATMPKDVPVYGTTVGGSRGDFEMNLGEPVDFVRRPPRLEGRRDVFCLLVQGTSMAPWRQPGDLVYVEANRAPQVGDYVVVELLPPGPDDIRPAYLKRLVGISPTQLKLQQFEPKKIIPVERRKIGRLLRVMDWSELLAV